MLAIDIMTPVVATASLDTHVSALARMMLEQHISGIPIVNAKGDLVGIVTEGDLLRRCEIGTERDHSKWAEFFMSTDALAAEYVKSHGCVAKDIMTTNVVTVDESTPVTKIAELFETRKIKRVPVTHDGRMIGIVSRANLLQALVTNEQSLIGKTASSSDRKIRKAILRELQDKPWKPGNVIVRNGVVNYWGVVYSDTERDAMRIAAERVPGVKSVSDHTTYMPVWPAFV